MCLCPKDLPHVQRPQCSTRAGASFNKGCLFDAQTQTRLFKILCFCLVGSGQGLGPFRCGIQLTANSSLGCLPFPLMIFLKTVRKDWLSSPLLERKLPLQLPSHPFHTYSKGTLLGIHEAALSFTIYFIERRLCHDFRPDNLSMYVFCPEKYGKHREPRPNLIAFSAIRFVAQGNIATCVRLHEKHVWISWFALGFGGIL